MSKFVPKLLAALTVAMMVTLGPATAFAGPVPVVTVPDAGTTISLMGISFVGLAFLRRKFR